MNSAPTISVLMPVYNGSEYLADAVESILAQTFGDFELIVVDDGSTDDSLEILQEYAKRDRRVRLISRPNTGIAGALNDAIATARAPLFARMDADDIALPLRFEKQVAFLEAHPEVVLVGSRVLLIDPYGTSLYESDHRLTHPEINTQMLSGIGWSVVHPSAMMRAAAARAAGGYRADRVPSEDLDLFLRLTEIGQAANLADILLKYRQHPTSANHTRFAEQDANKKAILTEAYARRGLELPSNWKPAKRNIMPMDKEISMWAWLALKKGNIPAARRHALSLVRLAPFSARSWQLMFCAIRGH